ncbi:Hypothetical protein KVN_LOCUS337 [uncultured virus]|nr:Hypothetical protein KVN_LOCUS337 [uncultured virus]
MDDLHNILYFVIIIILIYFLFLLFTKNNNKLKEFSDHNTNLIKLKNQIRNDAKELNDEYKFEEDEDEIIKDNKIEKFRNNFINFRDQTFQNSSNKDLYQNIYNWYNKDNNYEENIKIKDIFNKLTKNY